LNKHTRIDFDLLFPDLGGGCLSSKRVVKPLLLLSFNGLILTLAQPPFTICFRNSTIGGLAGLLKELWLYQMTELFTKRDRANVGICGELRRGIVETEYT